jgi:hypothetical protein
MGKIVGMLLMVVAIWVGMEVYNEGADRAFGGTFSFLKAGDDLPERAVHRVSTPKRVGKKVDAAIRGGAERYERLVGE